MCDGSSTGISTVSKPHFLKVENRLVLSVVKGDVKRNVLMPILIWNWREARATASRVKQREPEAGQSCPLVLLAERLVAPVGRVRPCICAGRLTFRTSYGYGVLHKCTD